MRYKKMRWVVRRERKGIYLATSSEQAKKKYPLHSPLDENVKRPRRLGAKSAAQLEPTESLRSPGTECEPTTMASTKLRKHARQIGGHTAAVHMRRAIHAAILVLAKIVPFAPMRVRKHSVCFGNQLELFFIAALQ